MTNFQNDDDQFFRNFEREQAAEIEITRDTFLRGFELAGQAARMFPGSNLIREYHTILAEQIPRIGVFERTPFDDRPIGFLEKERELFDRCQRGIVDAIEMIRFTNEANAVGGEI